MRLHSMMRPWAFGALRIAAAEVPRGNHYDFVYNIHKRHFAARFRTHRGQCPEVDPYMMSDHRCRFWIAVAFWCRSVPAVNSSGLAEVGCLSEVSRV